MVSDELLRNVIIIIVVVAAILITIFIVLPVFGFDLMRYLSITPSTKSISQIPDLSGSDYGEFEFSFDGMILPRGAGEDDISKILKEKPIVEDCTGCNSCSGIDIDTSKPGFEAYKCSSCSMCNGKSGTFSECYGCENGGPNTNCISCVDDGDEYMLCKNIKKCIVDHYGDKEYKDLRGCFLEEIYRNKIADFDVNDLKNVLSGCKEESITVNMGNNVIRELCYFDPSSISYYEFDRPSNFYINYKLHSVGSKIAQEDGLNLVPFYKEGGESLPRYKIYVAINGDPDRRYSILVGKFPIYDWTGLNIVGYQAKGDGGDAIGTIKTDSTGFGYIEITELPDQAHAWKLILGNPAFYEDYDWKKEPEKYPIKGVEVTDSIGGGPQEISAVFYANYPESNRLWSNDLRFSLCNFQTNPEIYLKDRPWWSFNSDNLNSTWKTYDDPNSSIKVYYDPEMLGGELSDSKSRGNIKLQLGRLDTDFSRTCKFDIYVCAQDAFAEYDGELVLSLTDFLSNFNSMNIHKVEDIDDTTKIVLYNYFELNLDKDYLPEEIRAAIKTGFRLWQQNQFVYDSPYSGLEWFRYNDGVYDLVNDVDGGVDYTEDCWNANVENVLINNDNGYLYGNCIGGMCAGKLKVRIAFKYTKPDALSPYKKLLYPTITFCSSGTPSAPAICRDSQLGGSEECDYGHDAACLGRCDYGTCTCKPYQLSCKIVSGGCGGASGNDLVKSPEADSSICNPQYDIAGVKCPSGYKVYNGGCRQSKDYAAGIESSCPTNNIATANSNGQCDDWNILQTQPDTMYDWWFCNFNGNTGNETAYATCCKIV